MFPAVGGGCAWMCAVALVSCAALVSASCESPWFEDNGSCYYISPDPESDELVLSWDAAENWCLQHGANLASIASNEELEVILNTTQAETYRGAVWIGLNRLKDQLNHEWVDGTVSDFRSWNSGQPKDGSVGMCVHQATNRESCLTTDEDRNFILTVLDKPEHAEPPNTFFFWSTYNLDDITELSRCQQSCADEPNCYYYTFISWALPNMTWDGTCTGASNRYVYNTVQDQYAYSGYKVDCQKIGTWSEDNCEEKIGFVCEKENGTPGSISTPPPTTPVPGLCPSGNFEAGVGIILSTGELAEIIIGTVLVTVLVCAVGGMLVFYMVKGELLFQQSKKKDATEMLSTYDLPYKNFDHSLSRSSSLKSASANRSEYNI